MTPDDIIPDEYNGQSFNRYTYVNNRPLTLTDPTGHDPAEGPDFNGPGNIIGILNHGPNDYFANLFNYTRAFGSVPFMTDDGFVMGEVGADSSMDDEVLALAETNSATNGPGAKTPSADATELGGGCADSCPVADGNVGTQSTPHVAGIFEDISPEEFAPRFVPFLEESEPVIPQPSFPYPSNPALPPAPGFQWRGNGPAGSSRGNWYDPTTGESLHPDLNHPDPVGPHWDWKAPDGVWYRWFPDGTIQPKGVPAPNYFPPSPPSHCDVDGSRE